MVEQAEEESKQKYGDLSVQFSQFSKEMDKKEELFTFAKLIDTKFDVWMNIMDFYGISSEFKSENLFYQKNTNNNIVFISDGLTEMMKYKRKYKLNVVNLGVKVFNKNRDQKSRATYRLLQEGLELLLPYMNDERKIHVTKDVFKTVIEASQIRNEELQKLTNAFDEKETGSAVMIYEDAYATIWIGKSKVSLMINKEEIKSFKFLI